MLMPSIFGENLLDDFFDYSFGSHKTFDMMNTDIKDTENGYEITMNMPGVRKEDVKAELKDGYLTIQATTDSSRDEKDSNGTYIRRERYCGSCSRSFYVGDAVNFIFSVHLYLLSYCPFLTQSYFASYQFFPVLCHS